jgi:hypothetical protein
VKKSRGKKMPDWSVNQNFAKVWHGFVEGRAGFIGVLWMPDQLQPGADKKSLVPVFNTLPDEELLMLSKGIMTLTPNNVFSAITIEQKLYKTPAPADPGNKPAIEEGTRMILYPYLEAMAVANTCLMILIKKTRTLN